jgi:hypothetical protein
MTADDFKAQRVKLDSRANVYISNYLKHASSLVRYVLDNNDLEQGTVFTYLPHGLDVTVERLHQFDQSLQPPPVLSDETLRLDAAGNRVHVVPVETLDHLVVPFIQDHLKADAGHLCIFEAGTRLSESAGFGYVGEARVMEHGDDGFLLLTADDASRPEHIRHTMRMTPAWQAAGILTSINKEIHLPPDKHEFTTVELRQLAYAATAIIVGAYDFESYLVWTSMEAPSAH